MSTAVRQAFTNDLDEHVGHIKGQVDRSMRDGDSRQLAVKIVSGNYDTSTDRRTGEPVEVIHAYGRTFMAPPGEICAPRDEECEIEAIWNFLVLNCRYVYDPQFIDTFATLRETMIAGGGDCFPEGTLVLRGDGRLVAIETIGVGDRIHDGTDFVEVLKTWDRGEKPLLRLGLNNGSTLTLSDTHKVLRVPHNDQDGPGKYGDERECRMRELHVGDGLLQPREFGGGTVNLDPDTAFMVGAYLSEGCCWRQNSRTEKDVSFRVSIAGVANGKGIREQVIEILERRGISYGTAKRDVRFALSKMPILGQFGHTALEKHLPHLDWDPVTTAIIVKVMEQGDGTVTPSGNTIYSTSSYELAQQYRILKRKLGYSVHFTRNDDHGGLGKNPIYRVLVRKNHLRRPWARIESIIELPPVQCYDVATESGRVYLPESDTIVRNCDDATIAFATLLGSLGFRVAARVISTNDDPNTWVHIYPLVGCSKDDPRKWIPLDITVDGAKPGWEYGNIAKSRDYMMV